MRATGTSQGNRGARGLSERIGFGKQAMPVGVRRWG
jgi:hypothetical protein